MRVRFGDCVLDSDIRQLFRGKKLVHLTPKTFRLLELFLENRPRALSKQELHETIWPGTFVSETTLSGAVSDIRAAIGEGAADPSWIRTVHGFGYAFSGEAIDSTASTTPVGASCYLLWEDRLIPLGPGDNLLGRAEDAGIRISHPSVSRHHARIALLGGLATLEDLESKNGTFIGEARIAQPARLRDGDDIRLGEIRLTFRLVSAANSTETVKHPGLAHRPASPESKTQVKHLPGKRGNRR